MTQAQDLAVLIGRFQPFHRGHQALLQLALAQARHVAVVIGSAFQARTPKNPFTWRERADVIRLTLGAADQERVSFLPVRDHYDEARWVRDVQAGVHGLAEGLCPGHRARIALVGHAKDATSDYLNHFDGWALMAAPRQHAVDGTHIRDAYFGHAGKRVEATLAALAETVPDTTLAFLQAWAALPHFAELAKEWEMLQRYKAAWVTAPYPPVFVTVDAVVKCANHVLLIQRAQAPGAGLWALPGGFIEQRETTYQSALRELREETRLRLLDSTMQHALKARAVFDHPDRSQRGRTITHAFFFDLGERALPEVQADDDAQAATWLSMAQLPDLEDRFHDDHFHILDHFLGLTPVPAG
ncbi:bifunctional nicotinamide-nucleotide adenylyltransferase/Nudix hydroxylase [Curvibacter gracilis]|uniref:bifunctional nicotinamide-nucleotide adenylyltransferase/Nudix hydroxylase n=1 Tax=Curvibacter gracilis TaxID=230310 RepID=UPI000483D3A4|nr:bifunctional nicotinamide-nucleotide adenylyltransferase/Nudix hydroxylase [Curvibacter gracilis]